MEQARRSLLSRLGTFASLETPTSEKMFSLAETCGLSPTEGRPHFQGTNGRASHCRTTLSNTFSG